MGWKSTMEITKADALAEIVRRLFSDATDKEIENALEALWGDREGYNFTIIQSYSDTAPGNKYRERDTK